MTPEAARLSAEINAALLPPHLRAIGEVRTWPTEQDAVMGNRGRARVYTTPDGVFPSVTTVLRVLGLSTEALVAWSAREERKAVLEAVGMTYAEGSHDGGPAGFVAAVESRIGQAKAHTKIINKAADVGTAAHHMIQWTLRKELGLMVGPEPELSEASLWAFMSWSDWWKASGLKPVRVEQPVWDAEMGYAGTVDLIALAPDDVLEVWDWKTSAGTYAEHHLQLAAYVHAARNWAEVRPGAIVRIPKKTDDPAFEVVKLGQMYGGKTMSFDELLQAFDAALKAWRLLVA